MPKLPGIVCATEDGARAVMLTRVEIDALHESIAAIEEWPTVAGPALDLDALLRLDRLLEFAGEAEPGDAWRNPQAVTLTGRQEEALVLVRQQMRLRGALPIRIQLHCTDCGRDKLVNPARQEFMDAEQQKKQQDRNIAAWLDGGLALLTGDDLSQAALVVLGDVTNDSAGSKPAAKVPPACHFCDGFNLEKRIVTFCPACQALRTETVLVTCPEPGCGYDFRTRAKADLEWAAPQDRLKALRGMLRAERVNASAAHLEQALYSAQRAKLVELAAVCGEPIALCRAQLAGTTGRAAVLLLTADELVWVRKGLFSSMTFGVYAWSSLERIAVRVAPPVSAKAAPVQTLTVQPREGEALGFREFNGKGVVLDTEYQVDGQDLTFDFEGMTHLMLKLHSTNIGGEPTFRSRPHLPNSAVPRNGLLWQRAANFLDLAERTAAAITDQADKAVALAEIAELLKDVDTGQAQRVADEAEHLAAPLTDQARKAEAMALVAVAVAATDSQRAARLADETERVVSTVTGEWEEVARLGVVARVLASIDPQRAARIAYQAERLIDAMAEEGLRALQLAMIAWPLSAAGYEHAVVITNQVERIADAITDEAAKGILLGLATCALAAVGSERAVSVADQAERLADVVTDSESRAVILALVAVGVAATDPLRASRAASGAEASAGAVAEPGGTMAMLGAAIAFTDPERTESFIDTITSETVKATTLVVMARVWLRRSVV